MRDLQYIADMLEASEEVAAMVIGVSGEVFATDRKLQLAITHLVQLIGEAATRVSKEFRESHPEIPWPLKSPECGIAWFTTITTWTWIRFGKLRLSICLR